MERSERSRKTRDPIPAKFNSIDDAAKFWDTHSVADYSDQLKEVPNVKIDIVRRHFRVEDKLARRIDRIARQKGVSPETLIHLWLNEKAS